MINFNRPKQTIIVSDVDQKSYTIFIVGLGRPSINSTVRVTKNTEVFSNFEITGESGVFQFVVAADEVLTEGDIFELERVTPITQTVDYSKLSTLDSFDVENSIDKLVLIAQEVSDCIVGDEGAIIEPYYPPQGGTGATPFLGPVVDPATEVYMAYGWLPQALSQEDDRDQLNAGVIGLRDTNSFTIDKVDRDGSGNFSKSIKLPNLGGQTGRKAFILLKGDDRITSIIDSSFGADVLGSTIDPNFTTVTVNEETYVIYYTVGRPYTNIHQFQSWTVKGG